MGLWYRPSNWSMGERGEGVGRGSGLSLSDVALPLSCIVSSALLCLEEETAARGITTELELAENTTSMCQQTWTFCVPQESLVGALTALTGAVLLTGCETFFASLGHLACFIGRI